MFSSCAANIASSIISSGTSLAPASIIITFSLVEATVRARSDFSLCSEVGLNTNLPSTRPTIVEAVGPSKGMSDILVAIEEPIIAVSSGEQFWSTQSTRLLIVTSLR